MCKRCLTAIRIYAGVSRRADESYVGLKAEGAYADMERAASRDIFRFMYFEFAAEKV